MRHYVMKAIQDDAQQVGQQDGLFLEARRPQVARRPCRSRRSCRAPGPAAVSPGDRLGQRTARWSTTRPQTPGGHRVHRALAGHEVPVDDGAAAEQAPPPLRTEPDNMRTFSAAPFCMPSREYSAGR